MSKELSGLAESIAKLAEEKGFRIILEPIQAVAEDPCKQPQKQASEPVGEPVKEAVKLAADAPVKRKRGRKQAKKPESWISVSECARLLQVADATIYGRVRRNMIPAKKDASNHIVVNANLLSGLPGYIKRPTCIPVMCINTGERYPSAEEAARKNGLSGNSLRKAIYAGKPCKGLTFKRLDEPNT